MPRDDASTASGLVDPLASLLGYQLRRASSLMLADLARDLTPLGLRPADSSVLLLIEANPGITQSDIGRLLAIQRANMAPLTARLEQRGWIARQQMDGRSHGLAVTAAGADVCGQVSQIVEAHEKRYAAGMPAEVHERLIRDVRAIWS